MPELPEVEVTRNVLDRVLSGRTIVSMCISEVWSKQLQRAGNKFPITADRKCEPGGHGGIIGREIENVSRNGKYYYINLKESKEGLEPDSWITIEGHLRMTGGWWIRPKGASWPEDFPDKHCHLGLELDDGSTAIYRDVRRFGTLRLYTEEDLKSSNGVKGLDPITSTWRFKDLMKSIGSTTRSAKTTLLDQSRIAGLGNIYVCEILHLAGIDPRRRANEISTDEWKKIHSKTKPILQESIQVGGTRLTNLDSLQYIHEPQLYLDNFEVKLQVYGRVNEPCLRRGCSGTIERIVQEQRSTFYCPSCQA